MSEKHSYLNKNKKQKNLSILIVDDEENFTYIFLVLLKKNGYHNTVGVTTGKEALSIFREKNFDIVFLDLLLPDMNGEKIFEEMKKINPEIDVVFITGQLGIDETEIIKKGVYAFLQKPFDFNEVFKIIENIEKGTSRQIGQIVEH